MYPVGSFLNGEFSCSIRHICHKKTLCEQVRIFLELVNWNVDHNKITILSQYRAQCSAIEKLLEGYGYEHPNVGTVIASQGMLFIFLMCYCICREFLFVKLMSIFICEIVVKFPSAHHLLSPINVFCVKFCTSHY